MFPRSILTSLILANSLFGADKAIPNPVLAEQLPDLEMGLPLNPQKSSATPPRPRARSGSSGSREYTMVRRPSNGSARSVKISGAMRTALSQLPKESQERLTERLLQPTISAAAPISTPTTPNSVSEELRNLNAVIADSIQLQSKCLTRQQEITQLQEQRLTEMTSATTRAKQIALVGAGFTAVYGTASFIIDNLSTIKALTGW